MSFVEFVSPGPTVIGDHQRLRNRGTDDAHAQYSLTTHTHAQATVDAGNTVVTYATGGVTVAYAATFASAPVPTCNIEQPSGSHPFVAYIASATATSFKVVIFAAGSEAAPGGTFRVYWQAVLP